MSTWTEGVCSDGAAILRDGVAVPISELLEHLNTAEERTRSSALEEAAKVIDDTVEGVAANERVLVTRNDGNLAGIAYAAAIRALKDNRTPTAGDFV